MKLGDWEIAHSMAFLISFLMISIKTIDNIHITFIFIKKESECSDGFVMLLLLGLLGAYGRGSGLVFTQVSRQFLGSGPKGSGAFVNGGEKIIQMQKCKLGFVCTQLHNELSHKVPVA